MDKFFKDIEKNISQSKITLIGYDSISEDKLENIISEFCNTRNFIDFVINRDNAASIVRDLKIQQLLDYSGYLFIDTEYLESHDLNLLLNFLDVSKLPFKIIIKCKLYQNLANLLVDIPTYYYKAGQKILYRVQLAFNFINNEIKMVKNNMYSN